MHGKEFVGEFNPQVVKRFKDKAAFIKANEHLLKTSSVDLSAEYDKAIKKAAKEDAKAAKTEAAQEPATEAK